jgi:hypothetical protein
LRTAMVLASPSSVVNEPEFHPTTQDDRGGNYRILANLRVDLLRRYASSFFTVPHAIKSDKDKLIRWILERAPDDVTQQLVSAGLTRKRLREDKSVDRARKQRVYQTTLRQEARDLNRANHQFIFNSDSSSFLDLPTEAEVYERYRDFFRATSNTALAFAICGVCARSGLVAEEGMVTLPIHLIPNRHRLRPSKPHPDHDLLDGILVERDAIQVSENCTTIQICKHCLNELKNSELDLPPSRSLSNNLWIGPIPHVLKRLSLPEQLLVALVYPRVFVFKLFPRRIKVNRFDNTNQTFQRAMRGNVCSYELDAPGIANMVEGNLMPRPPAILASVIQVTLFGLQKLPENWMRHIFRVRRDYLREALVWLKEHNPKFYGDIEICPRRLSSLPVDGVPDEILSISRQSDDLNLVERGCDSYIPGEDIRQLHFYCMTDIWT